VTRATHPKRSRKKKAKRPVSEEGVWRDLEHVLVCAKLRGYDEELVKRVAREWAGG